MFSVHGIYLIYYSYYTIEYTYNLHIFHTLRNNRLFLHSLICRQPAAHARKAGCMSSISGVKGLSFMVYLPTRRVLLQYLSFYAESHLFLNVIA